MPGTLAIDCVNTFASAFLMVCEPKVQFGSATGEQSTNSAGVKQWQVAASVLYLPGPSGRTVADTINLTVTSNSNPAQGIPQGSPITFERLRVGVSDPEKRDDGRGIRGGKMWFSAEGIRSASHQPAKTSA